MLALVAAAGRLGRMLSRLHIEQFLSSRHPEFGENFLGIISAASLDQGVGRCGLTVCFLAIPNDGERKPINAGTVGESLVRGGSRAVAGIAANLPGACYTGHHNAGWMSFNGGMPGGAPKWQEAAWRAQSCLRGCTCGMDRD
jgi:hypothetical protein